MSEYPLYLMDVTLREGNYLIDFSLDPTQARNLVDFITELPIPYLEVATAVPAQHEHCVSYLEILGASSLVKKKSKIGCLWTPLCETEILHEAFVEMSDFIRIGANITELSSLKNAIASLKKKNKMVCVQLIRSSTKETSYIADQVLLAEKLGADVVYIVDTFGSHIPETVREIFQEIKTKTTIPLGYHSHNNLGLSLQNSWTAIEEGCQWVDGSLTGVGRNPGNLQLENYILYLEKMGINTSINLELLFQICDGMISEVFKSHPGIPAPYLWAGFFNIDLQPAWAYQSLSQRLGLSLYTLLHIMQTSGFHSLNEQSLKYLSEKFAIPFSTLAETVSKIDFHLS